jgi:hypothetical protein
MKKRTILWFLIPVTAAAVLEVATTRPRGYPLPTTFEIRVSGPGGRGIPGAEATVRRADGSTPDEATARLATTVADSQGIARLDVDLDGRVHRGLIGVVIAKLGEDSVRRRAAVSQSLASVAVTADKPGWTAAQAVPSLDDVRNREELVGDTWLRDRKRVEVEIELRLEPATADGGR